MAVGAIEANAIERVPTWFGVGGGADRAVRVRTAEDVVAVLGWGDGVRVLGDGANLLVDDDGVDGVVLDTRGIDGIEVIGETDDGAAIVRMGAGVPLGSAIGWCVKRGMAGLENVAGIPARLGGAVAMNAGGRFGEIGDVLRAVEVVTADGEIERREASRLGLGYRSCALDGAIVCAVEVGLARVEGASGVAALRARHDEVRAYKRATQPTGGRSAGCVFRNPTVDGVRTSAGQLIDQAGAKGRCVGGARVSDVHANFVVTEDRATAGDVIGLANDVRALVERVHGVVLDAEVVVWRRGGRGWWD